MLNITLAALLALGLGSSGATCSEASPNTDYHLQDVCSSSLKGSLAYSVTFKASLSPAPAAQQVMMYQFNDRWLLRIAGYRWKPGSEAVTRRNTVNISETDAELVIKAITMEALDELSKRPFFGDENVICTDGATLEVAMGQGGRHLTAAQHSCAPKSEMNELAAVLQELALKYDRGFDGLLSGLDNGR